MLDSLVPDGLPNVFEVGWMINNMRISLSSCESSTMMASPSLWMPSASNSCQVSLESLVARARKQPSEEEIRAIADYCEGTLKALSE